LPVPHVATFLTRLPGLESRGYPAAVLVGDQTESGAGSHVPRPGPDRWQVVALVVALCFLSGVVGWRIDRPDDETFSAVDVGFLGDMENHHNGAIGLSFAYLRREHDPLVGHFAREIVIGQSQEIAAMNGYLARAGTPASASDDLAMEWMGHPVRPAGMPGMPTEAESAALDAAQGPAADDQFTHLMIRHHAGGVAMAEYASEHGENAGVRKFAASMAKVQRTEINEINNRRRALGLTLVPRREIRQLERLQA
jgi:uncharacterized protein (DUF305 family)